jgi:hypothetical protein
MYTSVIGKRFLEIYNEERKRRLSSQEYFEKEYFPLFYDHSKYLQSPANTPLFQVIAQKKTNDPKARKKAYSEIVEKINSFSEIRNSAPDMSFALGYASADLMGTTSGQVTSLQLPFDSDDIYASWIGAGFGIGIAGGLNILLDAKEVISATQEGWNLYREYVDENKGIDNKVETWNGIWLTHRFSNSYKQKTPRADFHPVSLAKGDEAKMERPSWVSVLFTLSQIYPSKTLNAYIYCFSQMNRTVGFVRLALPEVHKLSELYYTLFGKSKPLSNESLAQVYESEYGLSAVCERFSLIGLRSLEPKDLKKYIPGRFNSRDLPVLKNDEKNKINYSIYITWIIAMLKNKDLLELAEKFANGLKEFIAQEKKVRLNRSNAIDKFLSSKNRKEIT